MNEIIGLVGVIIASLGFIALLITIGYTDFDN